MRALLLRIWFLRRYSGAPDIMIDYRGITCSLGALQLWLLCELCSCWNCWQSPSGRQVRFWNSEKLWSPLLNKLQMIRKWFCSDAVAGDMLWLMEVPLSATTPAVHRNKNAICNDFEGLGQSPNFFWPFLTKNWVSFFFLPFLTKN